MSRFLTLLTVFVVLAIVQAAVAALAIALTIMLLFYLVTRPRETLVFIASLLAFGLASARPTAFIVAVGTVVLTVFIVDALRKPRHRLLLSDGREHRSPGPARLDRDLLG